MRWKFPVPKGAFEGTAAIVNGVVYIGDLDGSVFAISLATGEKRWEYKVESGFIAAPAVHDGMVYIGDYDGRVYCLNAKTGKLLWRSSIPEAEQRRIPGNGRIISLYPVRIGIFVNGDTACFGCGISPKSTGVGIALWTSKRAKSLTASLLKPHCKSIHKSAREIRSPQ